jgi:hypothetical protein
MVGPIGAFGFDDDFRLSDLPHSQSGGLALAAYASREIPIRIIYPQEKTNEQSRAQAVITYVIHVYLINRGTLPATFLLGTENQVGEARSSTILLISFYPSFWNGFSDVSLKPRIEDFRPITLKPGEVAALPVKRIEVDKPPTRLRVGYSVPEEFKKFSDVWTGTVTVDVPVP